jgi:hypothetical protein
VLVDAVALGAGEALVLRLGIGQATEIDEAGVSEGRAQGLLVVEEGVAPVAKGVVDHQRCGVAALVVAEGLCGPGDVHECSRVLASGGMWRPASSGTCSMTCSTSTRWTEASGSGKRRVMSR